MRYHIGLDIGSGTGQSSLALSNYCDKVIGVEPSAEMLANAISHSKVKYRNGYGENLDFESEYFDIITFAGSLYYAKSQKVLNEVVRVSKPTAKIIIYDFEILLADLLDELNVRPTKKTESTYNHQENFSGLHGDGVKLLNKTSEKMAISIEPSDLAHLILSEKSMYESLRQFFGQENLYHKIQNHFIKTSNGRKHEVEAKIFYTVYECSK